MTPTLLLVPLAALLAGWLGVRLTRGRRQWVRAVVGVLTAVVVLGAALQVWARTSLDSSAWARAMTWYEADVDDIDRFPARPIPAGDDVLPLRTGGLAAGTLDDFRIGGAARDLDGLMDVGDTRRSWSSATTSSWSSATPTAAPPTARTPRSRWRSPSCPRSSASPSSAGISAAWTTRSPTTSPSCSTAIRASVR